MKYATIARPNHPAAQCFVNYQVFASLSPRFRHLLRNCPLLRGDLRWLGAALAWWLIVLFFFNDLWWVKVLLAEAVSVYLGLTWEREPLTVRRYERYQRQGHIILVPLFVTRACDRAAKDYPGLLDWGEFPERRFVIFEETLAEGSVWLAELEDDCGCTGKCGHTNRLSNRNRDGLRRLVRRVVEYRVGMQAQAYAGALEANDLRNAVLRRTLRGLPSSETG